MTLRKRTVLRTEKGNARSYHVENFLQKGFWTYRKTRCGMNK
jgi:hypothetical protein